MTKPYLPNLKVHAEELPDRFLVCGDPGRAKAIANELKESEQLASNREYHLYRGRLRDDTFIGVASHGVGGPGAAVCFEELIQGGVRTIIRVGTAGSYQKDVPPGSLVISSAAVRCDGLSKQLVPEGFPAVASRYVVEELRQAADRVDADIAEGITLTLDAFYNGVVTFPHNTYKEAGVLAVEMENAALYTIATLRGVEAGAILAIDGYADDDLREAYNPDTDWVKQAVEDEMGIALEAIGQL
ncbi:nucleoside phosphorylase [Alteribacter aurantiacus]|uniref:nucleoside phosphorylase n=1 Tax=Alteribacter aurantiacus TaxID=254410 RepID=UPI0004184286|nr:nucleoside phosphorylase [Alteribacter aurantiacus]